MRLIKSNRMVTAALAGLGITLSAAACGGGAETTAGAAPESLQFIVGAAPGGGWDQTARAAQQALEQGRLVKSAEVTNIPGAAGTIGLARAANEKGNPETLLVTGTVMVGGIETNKSPNKLSDLTPIARLTSDYVAIVVPAKSPHQTIEDFVAAWKTDPGKFAIAGGSAGGADHILMGLLAKEAGIDPKQMNYVPFAGGGEAAAAILGNKVAVGVSGVSEFLGQVEAGNMRLLALSGPERLDGVDAPTLKESGFDVEFVNWRGFVAPPGLSAEQTSALQDVVAKMHESEQWKAAVTKNKWIDDYASGDEFAAFLKEDQEQIRTVLTELGLL
jgi:putative tricarboxylic transport membrane protein